MSLFNSNCSKNLVLHYFPILSGISITDLTKFSTNCIKKNSTQKNYQLLNSEEIQQGKLELIINTTIFTDKPDISSSIWTTIIEISTKFEKEIYSFDYYDEFILNDNTQVSHSYIIYVNLTCVSGNNTYTKLKWEFIADSNEQPTYRILTFYK